MLQLAVTAHVQVADEVVLLYQGAISLPGLVELMRPFHSVWPAKKEGSFSRPARSNRRDRRPRNRCTCSQSRARRPRESSKPILSLAGQFRLPTAVAGIGTGQLTLVKQGRT